MPTIGDPAPNVSGTDVLSGATFDLSSHASEVVILNFAGYT